MKFMIIVLASVAWCWHQTAVRCTVAALVLLAIHPALLVIAFVGAVVYMRRPSPMTDEDRAAKGVDA